MSRCGVEPRAAVALALMSVVVWSTLRRAGAFRAWQIPGFQRGRRSCGDLHERARGNSRGHQAYTKDAIGPEGSTIPDVVHRTVEAHELKVMSVSSLACYSCVICCLS